MAWFLEDVNEKDIFSIQFNKMWVICNNVIANVHRRSHIGKSSRRRNYLTLKNVSQDAQARCLSADPFKDWILKYYIE